MIFPPNTVCGKHTWRPSSLLRGHCKYRNYTLGMAGQLLVQCLLSVIGYRVPTSHTQQHIAALLTNLLRTGRMMTLKFPHLMKPAPLTLALRGFREIRCSSMLCLEFQPPGKPTQHLIPARNLHEECKAKHKK